MFLHCSRKCGVVAWMHQFDWATQPCYHESSPPRPSHRPDSHPRCLPTKVGTSWCAGSVSKDTNSCPCCDLPFFGSPWRTDGFWQSLALFGWIRGSGSRYGRWGRFWKRYLLCCVDCALSRTGCDAAWEHGTSRQSMGRRPSPPGRFDGGTCKSRGHCRKDSRAFHEELLGDCSGSQQPRTVPSSG